MPIIDHRLAVSVGNPDVKSTPFDDITAEAVFLPQSIETGGQLKLTPLPEIMRDIFFKVFEDIRFGLNEKLI